MIIKSAEFIISNSDYKKCPQDGKPEYAFIGRIIESVASKVIQSIL
jgi:GTP-binding protein EngB required for normal cell division